MQNLQQNIRHRGTGSNRKHRRPCTTTPKGHVLRFLSLCCLFALSPIYAYAANGKPSGLVFTDVTAQSGVGLPGTLTESVAWGDYDNDGDQDLYLTNNGANKLFRNEGSDVFTDVTDSANVGSDLFSVGAAFGDLDNDGDLDLYVVTFNGGPDVLYRNNGRAVPGGEITFTDITSEAGTTLERSSRGLALLDFDNDGLLDIYINAIGDDLLYHNKGNLRFADVAASVGVTASSGIGVGVVATDVNNDGRIDIFNGNRSGELSNLYINSFGLYHDLAASFGIDGFGLGMGVHAFDYDNDLDMDLYWTTWPGTDPVPVANRLYQNQGDGHFIDVAEQTGTTDPLGWGISNNAGDINNDRWMDFVITNGFSDSTSPNVLFLNRAGASFDDVTGAIGGGAFDGRGAAFADYDNDGDLDLVITGDIDAETRLWRNDTPSDNHSVTLNLVGQSTNRSAIGARIEVSAGGMTTVQEVSGGAGRGSFNSLPVEFGLGRATSIDEISVYWPSGIVQRLAGLTADQTHTITEPADLTSHIEDSSNPAVVRETFTWSIEVINNVAGQATGVNLVSIFTGDINKVSVNASQGSCSFSTSGGGKRADRSTVVDCAIGNLPGNAIAQIDISMKPKSVGTLVNSFTVSGDQTETDFGNNIMLHSTPVVK